MINAKDIKQAITDPLKAMVDFGINEELLTPKGSACPVCGDGTDRFSYDKSKYNGERVFCRSCGSLDYLDVIQQVNGWNFKTLINELADYTGLSKMDYSQRESLQKEREIAEKQQNKRIQTEYINAVLLVDLSVLFNDTIDLEVLSVAEEVIRKTSIEYKNKIEQTGSYQRHKWLISYYGGCKMNDRSDIVQLIRCYKFLSCEPTNMALIRDAKNIILLHTSFNKPDFDVEWIKRYFDYYAKILRGSV